jgi:hypothetical protein
MQNVTDQLRLWEQETLRVEPVESVLYEDFETQELYESTLAFAHQKELLLWAPETEGVWIMAIKKRGEWGMGSSCSF